MDVGILSLPLLIGCQSVVSQHGSRLDSVYRAQGELADVSKKLDDIAQTMLFAGRIHDAPLADFALDVAIAIHGEPDGQEKAYAQTITPELIAKDKVLAEKLLARRDSLLSFIAKEGRRLTADITALAKLEAECSFLRGLIWKFTIGIGGILLIFFCLRFLFRW
jgi:hypothetical protein